MEKKGKISEGSIGRVLSSETRHKLSIIAKNRPPMPEEIRRKIGEANTGRIRSDETRRKLSEALMGRIVSAETRRKHSGTHERKVVSVEVRRKIRDSRRSY